MEIFKIIQGYTNYEISNYGRVKSTKNSKIKFLKQSINNSGYYDCQLCENAIVKHHRVHRLVAEHFIDKPGDNYIVNHKDGNKLNNNVVNLEWVTYSENHQHALKNNLRKTGGDLSFSKPIDQYDLSNNLIKTYGSTSEASKELNIPDYTIWRCLNNIKKSHNGFIFRYH